MKPSASLTPAAQSARCRRRWLGRAASVVAVVGAGLGLSLLSACQERAAPASGWAGYAEGEYVYVSSPVGGTLTALAVRRGQNLAQGTLLFQLDSALEQAVTAEAEAQVLMARAQAANTAKPRREDEIAVIRAQLAQARAAADRAEVELRRQQILVSQDFITRSRLDDAASAATQARARVAELEAALRVAQLPARDDEVGAARAHTDATVQAQRQAQWRESQKVQLAPVGGVVFDTFYRVGEYVPAGQAVVALLPPEQRKARFFVPESELGSLALGQTVELVCDGCGSPIAARISHIATQAEYTPPVIYSNTQRARLVFMVEARPDAVTAARLHPGQPLEVRRSAFSAKAAP